MSGWAALGSVIDAAAGIGGGAYGVRKQDKWITKKHRLAVHDLRMAGLNPILSATGGLGGSSAGSPNIGVKTDFANAALLEAQIENTEANTAKAKAEARKENIEADWMPGLLEEQLLSTRHTGRAQQELKYKLRQEADNIAAKTKLELTGLPKKKITEAIYERVQGNLEKALYDWDKQLDRNNSRNKTYIQRIK
jgi:hypothetical protein